MNQTIPSENINFRPYTELFPNTVIGGVEVKDDLIDDKNTWSSQKLSNEFHSLSDGLTQAIEDIDLSPYEQTANKSTDGTLTDNSDAKYPSQKAIKTYVDTGLGTKQNNLGYTAENQANKNIANGYSGLNSLGFIDLSRLNETTKDYVETFIDTDFHDANLDSYSMALPWAISNSGGNSSFRLATTDGNLNLSTSNSSAYYIGYSKPNLFVLSSTGNYEFWLQYGFRIDTLSDATNRYEIVLGSESNNLIANNTNRMSIRYSDNANSGKFQIITKLAGNQTTTDTNVTVEINKNYDIKFKVTPSGLTVYINDVAQSLITSNVPYDVILKSGFMIRKSIGTTARLLRMEYCKSYRINTTAKRY